MQKDLTLPQLCVNVKSSGQLELELKIEGPW